MNTCEICTKQFYVKPSREKRCHARFCSWECFTHKIIKNCSECGKQYKVQRWQEKISKQCSKDCHVEAQKKQVGYWKNKKRPYLKLPHFWKVGDNTGSQHPNWKGGVTSEQNKIRNSLKQRKWIKDIFKRDNYTCTLCGKRGGDLIADHFPFPFYKYPEKRLDLNNGRTLCFKCNYQVTYKERVWQYA